MPMVDRQQPVPLPQRSAGLLLGQPQDATAYPMPQPQAQGQPMTPVMEMIASVMRGLGEGVAGGYAPDGGQPSGQGNPNVNAALETAALLAGMVGMPGPDMLGPAAKGAGDAAGWMRETMMELGDKLRMMDAKKMGFDVENPVYHGTRQSFDQFRDPIENAQVADFGIHTGPPNQASRFVESGMETSNYNPNMPMKYLQDNGIGPGLEKSGNRPLQVMKLLGRKGKVAVLPDFGDWSKSMSILTRFTNNDSMAVDAIDWREVEKLMGKEAFGRLDRPLFEDIFVAAKDNYINMQAPLSAGLDRTPWVEQFDAILKKHGVDTIEYPNFVEGAGESSFMFTKPEQLRSAWAQFDPSKMDSKDLMAAIAALTSIKVLNKDDSGGN